MDCFAAALPGLPGLGAKRIRALITFLGSAEAVWRADSGVLRESGILPVKLLGEFLAFRNETDPEREGKKLEQAGVRAALWTDPDYPPLLAETANPPAVIFYEGAPPVWEKTVAIVGARKATAYGVNAARHIAEGLAREGVTIVSGGARGIDTVSHEGALSGSAPTAVVLACGLDVTYPPENRNLFRKIRERGGTILSEYPLGTPPLGRQFPARNRIIAGMSRGVVVTEAAERSGSLITSDFALEEGRDVFAVPGSIWSSMSRGTNQLIRHGAICVTGPGDILSEYGWDEEKEEPGKAMEALTLEEELVYQFCAAADAASAEDLIQQTGFSLAKLTMILLSLAVKGYIGEAGPGMYAAKK